MNKLSQALLLSATHALKVGVISDLHLNLAYNPIIAAGNCGQSSSSVIGDPVAEFSRYGCDSSQNLIETMLTRFLEKFGTPDVLLICGDHVAHKVSASTEQDDPTGSAYAAVKTHIAAVYQIVSEYFPNTIVMPTIGNNDGRYHSMAIDEDDKQDYYSFLYQQWFEVIPGNKSLASTSVKNDIMAGGYYSITLPGTKYTIVNMNSMYCDIDDEVRAVHGNEVEIEASWLQYQFQLARAIGHKIILIDHVYAGSRWQGEILNKPDCAKNYYSMLRDYHDVVIIEVVGHDHYSDLRYHSSNNVLDLPDTDVKFDFHNMLVSPGITPWDEQNPGVAFFEINDSTYIPQNLRMEFLNLDDTIGKSGLTYADLQFNSFDLAKDWGQQNIDPTSLADFRKRIEPDEALTLNYLVAKLGFNPNVTSQFDQGVKILTDYDLVTSSKHHTGEYICQMHFSLDDVEYLNCAAAANPPALEFLQ